MSQTVYPDAAPSTCALTANAQARLSLSSCFSSLQNIISCMPPAEQDVWANANSMNTNTGNCFDCTLVNPLIKNTIVANVNSIGNKITQVAFTKRAALSCFLSFANSTLAASDQVSTLGSLDTLVSNQKKSAQTTASLLQNVANVFISRRRFLCLPNSNRYSYITVNDTSSNPIEFLYNLGEATQIVNSFILYFNQKIKDLASSTNEVSTMNDIVANSQNCTTSNTINTSYRVNGKALGQDVATYISQVSASAQKINTVNSLAFSSKLTASFNGNTPVQSQTGGFYSFFLNINNVFGSSYNTIQNLLNFRNQCSNTNDFVYIINGGSMTCEGACSGFINNQIQFIDSTQVPSTYYFAAGCSSGSRFNYGTWSDITKNSIIYTSFKLAGKVDTDARELQKASGCVPGGRMTAGNSADGSCSPMTPVCMTNLSYKCARTGLANYIGVQPPVGLPTACDFAAQSADRNSQTFITTCLTWISQNYFKRSMTFNPDALTNESTLTNAPTTYVRLLQTSTSVVVIPNSQDFSANNNVNLQGVSLLSTDVQVDGSTPAYIANNSASLAQILATSSALSGYSVLATSPLVLLALLFALLI